MTNPTLAPQSDEYQQIHDGIMIRSEINEQG